MNVGQYSPHVGRVKSCTGCRQVKLACDARKTLPEPCSRCQKKGTECRFDINFKRVLTRKLVAEMHNELGLRSSSSDTNESGKMQALTVLQPPVSMFPVIKPSLPQANITINLSQPLQPWLSTTEWDRSRVYMLESVKMHGQIAVELFQHFELQHIHHAIFLESVSSLSNLLESSALLFWIILLVACQNHDQYVTFYDQIAYEVDNLLSSVVRSAIQDIKTIHSLLLLALWPIPRDRKMYDPAGNYLALATNAAMQLNCHNPLPPGSAARQWRGFGDKAGNEISQESQALTWLACFIIGTRLAGFHGFPPPMSSMQQLKLVDRALDQIPPLVSASSRVVVGILKITTTSTNMLDGSEDPNTHFIFTQTFDRQLDDLKATNHAEWTSKIEIDFCNAKLYLYGQTFTLASSIDNQTKNHRDNILHKALYAASALIMEMKKINNHPVVPSSGFYPCGMLTFVPELYFTALFNAITFLFRFLATDSLSRTPLQESVAMGSIIEAHKIFQSFPGHRDHIRAAIHTELLVSIIRDKNRSGGSAAPSLDELEITNRLGASVMLDAAFRAARQRNRDPVTGEYPPTKEWKTLNEVFGERLPKAPILERGSNSSGSQGGGGSQKGQGNDDPVWWAEWDNYMDHFQVGLEQWPELDRSMGQQQQQSDGMVEMMT